VADLSVSRCVVVGDYYKADVPDTLDLAERAKLGIAYFLNNIETSERHPYEMFVVGHFSHTNPPYLVSVMQTLGSSQCKALEAMAFLRLMTGSVDRLDLEAAMVQMMTSLFREDGLYWVPGGPEKPWLGPEPFVYIHGQGRMLRAMIAWHQYTGHPEWKRRCDALVDGLDNLATHRDDFAYYPVLGSYDEAWLSPCVTPERGWGDDSEPMSEKDGEEASLFNHQGHIAGALANWAQVSGNQQALRLSGEFVRLLTKSKFWADWREGEYPNVHGADHAHWDGHFHGYVNTLRSILEYALVTNDARLKSFVRDGYEWTRSKAFPRIGYVGDGQAAGCARLIGLAVKLSYAGVGDYWEDVDQYIRNHGVEMQWVPEDADYLSALSEGQPPPEDSPDVVTENVVGRSIGGFPAYPC